MALAAHMLWRQRSKAAVGLLAMALVGPAMLAVAIAGHEHGKSVLMAARVALVGRHVVVGYRTPAEVEPLIARGAVGGLFVTARNARGKTVDQVSAEIARFQDIARRAGRPPLIVTTDQEGGFVSRLSPPLDRPPLLATLMAGATTPDERRTRAEAEGRRVGRDLARVGITMNLAPLADLDFGIRNPADRMSRIGERAISRDPDIVAEIAKAYCDGMAAAGVICTLKHFPGLGRVAADTHVEAARLDVARDDLAARDWRPYRASARSSAAAVMVGHVVATALDPAAPASVSRGVVTDVLRAPAPAGLAFDGLVITDDLCMAAIADRPGGIAAAAAATIKAGVDLVLVSYDPEQVHAALSGMLAALTDADLADSRGRLDRMLASTAAHRP